MDYSLHFEIEPARLNQMDLHPGKWHVVPGTSLVRVSTRVLAGWLLHIAVNPDTVDVNDVHLVQCMVESAELEDLHVIGLIVRYATVDWMDCRPCQAVLQCLNHAANLQV